MAITTVLSNFHIPQRLRSLGTSSAQVEQKLEHLKKKATGTHTALSLRSHGGTPLTQLVEFYRLVSPWCDRSAELIELERDLARIDYGQATKAREALVSLAAQEERNEFNRTLPGQVPSMDTTFLGERFQLSTKTASYWESVREELGSKPAIIGKPHPPVMEVIDDQALELLNDGLDQWYQLLFDLMAS